MQLFGDSLTNNTIISNSAGQIWKYMGPPHGFFKGTVAGNEDKIDGWTTSLIFNHVSVFLKKKKKNVNKI